MILLKKASLLALSLSNLTVLSVIGEEPVCHRCEEIREYNAKYHENFEYYDEYVKREQGSSQKTAAAPAAEQDRKETASITKKPTQSSQNKPGSSK